MNTSVMFSSASVHWATPVETFASLDAEFRFDFDPCPLGSKIDGLASSWVGRRVYCNPPYGRHVGDWFLKGLEADVSVFLVPARTDTKWFHDIVMPNAAEIRFLRGRLKFGDAKNGAPFPSMVVIFKKEPHA